MCSLGFLSACSDDVTGNESTTPNVFTDIFLTDVGKTAVKSSNEFAFTMINHFMEEAFEYSDPDNVCVSPYSLYFVLAMLVNGSEDVGQEKMLNLMGDVNKDELSTFNAAYSKLTSTLTHFDSKVNLGIANSLWHNKGLNVTPGFRSIMDTYYL